MDGVDGVDGVERIVWLGADAERSDQWLSSFLKDIYPFAAFVGWPDSRFARGLLRKGPMLRGTT